MLKYAYELGAAAALEDFTKEAWPQWLTGLFGSGLSKAISSEGTRRAFLARPATRAVAHAATEIPGVLANSAALGGVATTANALGKAALKDAPDLSRRGFLKTLGAAGAAGAAATAGHVAAKVEPAAGNAISSINNLGSIVGGDLGGSSPLARRIRMFSEAKRLAQTPVSQITAATGKDMAKVVRDAMLDVGPAAVMDTAVGGSARFGLNLHNPLPGIL